MSKFLQFAGAIMSLIASLALGQTTSLNDPCQVQKRATSTKPFLPFDRFDRELREALLNQDPVAMAFLVKFPLRVDDAGGTISIDDAAALKSHFQEVFTPAVRKNILSDKDAKLGCTEEGLMYGSGSIWVNVSDVGYAVWAVNRDVPAAIEDVYKKSRKIDYLCTTKTHRIVIDSVVGGAPRYRSWNTPKSIVEKPDLEIAQGEEHVEGTQACVIPVYTFTSGTARFQISGGLGCTDGSEPPGTTGNLEVTVAGKPATDSWCY